MADKGKLSPATVIIFIAITSFFFPIRSYGIKVRKEKCAICHIYDSIFADEEFSRGKGSDPWEDGTLCLSCHNGSVVDSRDSLLKGAQHPTVEIEHTSLAKGEKSVKKGCTVCHSPHSDLGWKGFAGKNISIYFGGEDLCVTCHPTQKYVSKGKNHLYGKRRGCLSCHKLHGGSTSNLLRGRYGTLCNRCHEKVYRAGKKKDGHAVGSIRKRPVIITGRADFEGRETVDLNCYICHRMHDGGTNKFPVDAKAVCVKCHISYLGSPAGGKNNGNHPAVVGCADCHQTHNYNKGEPGTSSSGRLTVPVETCRKCHKGKFGKKGNKKNHIYSEGEDGGGICFTCHSIHRGVVGTPNLASKGDIICIDCHGEKNTLNENRAKPLSHPVFDVLDDDKVISDIKVIGGAVGKFNEVICRSCHRVHNASNERLLVSEYRNICIICHDIVKVRHGKKEFPCTECHQVHGIAEGNRSKGEDPIRVLCVRCHERRGEHKEDVGGKRGERFGNFPFFDNRGNSAEKGFVSCPTCHESHGKGKGEYMLRETYRGSTFLCVNCHQDKENVTLTPHDLRGIASDSLCEPCHLPHDGNNTLMWGLGEGPVEGERTLCFFCHKQGGMATPIISGEGHPVNIIPGKKEGIPFLYYDTDWKENELGMIACPTCHDVHGKGLSLDPERRNGILNLSYSFLGETGFIERKNFCSICHRGKGNIVSGVHGQYVCEDCHKPHEDFNAPEGEATFSWFCVKCHEDIPAKNAIAFKIDGAKPGDGRVDKAQHLLFDTKGRRSSEGFVTCPSCHEIHSGKKDITLSFKLGGEDITCYACHMDKKSFKGSKHDFNQKSGSSCVECHGICTESISRTDIESLSEKKNANLADGKCFYCHEGKKGFYLTHPKKVTPVKSSYGATVAMESDIIMVSKVPGQEGFPFPLFNKSGRAGESGSLGCLTCHDPHNENTIGDKGGKFLRDESGLFISSICQPCHDSGSSEHVNKFHYMKRKEN